MNIHKRLDEEVIDIEEEYQLGYITLQERNDKIAQLERYAREYFLEEDTEQA